MLMIYTFNVLCSTLIVLYSSRPFHDLIIKETHLYVQAARQRYSMKYNEAIKIGDKYKLMILLQVQTAIIIYELLQIKLTHPKLEEGMHSMAR